MLGNASEMMFEPFRLNKLDRQHGQAGGFVVRGGNYLTSEGELRTALRQEEPYYNAEGRWRKDQRPAPGPGLADPDLARAGEEHREELGIPGQ